MRVLFVLPALNEEEAIAPLLDELGRVAAELRLDAQAVVVDDGSRDETADVAAHAGARVVRLCRNLGIGGAVQCGLRLALREGFDCAVQLDGDGQHPPAEVKKLLAAFADASAPDLIVGTRYATNGGFRSTALRRLGGRWLRFILRLVAGVKVTDPTSGYRLYGKRALSLFDQTYPYDYPEPEALVLAQAARLRIVEVPVVMRERQGGQSSIAGLSAPYYMFKVTLAVILAHLRAPRVRPPSKEPHATG
jgi:glycosyltransferase involved in cell wall biosynthesis